MKRTASHKGFSILELLIALIIIGILAVILIPLVSNRTEEARRTAALADLERLANAQDRLAVDIGYYGRLFFLNDVGNRANAQQFQRDFDPADGTVDSISSYFGPGSNYFGNINQIFIDPNTGNLVAAVVGSTLLGNINVNETALNFYGPYVNWNRDENSYSQSPFDGGEGTAYLPDGIPDDPWGNNYVIFTRAGMLLEPAGIFTTSASFPLGLGGVTVSNLDEAFDRATLVSFGPDGLPGDGAGTPIPGEGDDIVRNFGQ
ncbi:MAG: prepilin-type N-terminal cleavage/methylation domain-containing protein [Sumerlaeia bacterium]